MPTTAQRQHRGSSHGPPSKVSQLVGLCPLVGPGLEAQVILVPLHCKWGVMQYSSVAAARLVHGGAAREPDRSFRPITKQKSKFKLLPSPVPATCADTTSQRASAASSPLQSFLLSDTVKKLRTGSGALLFLVSGSFTVKSHLSH